MALLLMEGFNDGYAAIGDRPNLTIVSPSDIYAFTTGGRNNTGRLQLGDTASSNPSLDFGFTAGSSTICAGLAFRNTCGYTSNDWPQEVMQIRGNGFRMCELILPDEDVANGPFQIRDSNGTVQWTGGNWSSVNWDYLELKVTSHATAGTIQFYKNGALLANLSGLDTAEQGGTGTTPTSLYMRSRVRSANDCYWDIDDMYVVDSTGTVNNDRLGDVHIQTVLPDGDGAETDWTPTGAGTGNYERVDNPVNTNPVNFQSDYIESSTETDIDRYDFAATTLTEIKAVAVRWYGVMPAGGSQSVRAKYHNGSTYYDGDDMNLSGDWLAYDGIFEQNPDGPTTWTASAVNSNEFGIELRPPV